MKGKHIALILEQSTIERGETMTKGRKKATGRFDTRAEFEECIWNLYRHTGMNITDIARFCRVSQPVVSKILDHKPKEAAPWANKWTELSKQGQDSCSITRFSAV